MQVEELKRILELHEKWLDGKAGGVRANLEGACGAAASRPADLRGAKLDKLGLLYAILQGVDVENIRLID